MKVLVYVEGPEELKALLTRRFHEQADQFGLPDEVRSHYRVHCLKHDLEVLLLGAAETQNDNDPPKRVVERLFMKYRKQRYIETTDAPWILERVSPQELCASCPQNFKPLFTELDRLSRGELLAG